MTSPLRPEDLLPGAADHAQVNGVTVRKGTIGAFLANVGTLRELADDDPQRSAITAELRSAVPLLRSIGLFDVFRFRDEALAELLGADLGG